MALEAKTSRYLFYGALFLTVFAVYLGQSRLGTGNQVSSDAQKSSELAVDVQPETAIDLEPDDTEEITGYSDGDPSSSEGTKDIGDTPSSEITQEPVIELDSEANEVVNESPTSSESVPPPPVEKPKSSEPTETGDSEQPVNNPPPTTPVVKNKAPKKESKNKKVCVIGAGNVGGYEWDEKLIMEIVTKGFDLITQGHGGIGAGSGVLDHLREIYVAHRDEDNQLSIYAGTGSEEDVEDVDMRLDPKPFAEMQHIALADYIIAMPGVDKNVQEIEAAKKLGKKCMGIKEEPKPDQKPEDINVVEKAMTAAGFEMVTLKDFSKIVEFLGGKAPEDPPPKPPETEKPKTEKPPPKTPAKSSAPQILHGGSLFGVLALALLAASH